jgi:hypothetical protein
MRSIIYLLFSKYLINHKTQHSQEKNLDAGNSDRLATKMVFTSSLIAEIEEGELQKGAKKRSLTRHNDRDVKSDRCKGKAPQDFRQLY